MQVGGGPAPGAQGDQSYVPPGLVAPESGPRRKSRWWIWLLIAFAVCFAGCAAVAVANTRARESVIALSQGANKTYSIVSESMAPDIPRGALVAATDVGTPKRGDVVVSTASLPGVDASEVAQIVKRVVGLPGERIEGRDGSVYVNGEPLAEPYASGRTEFGSQAVTLGPDEYFVLGDNRANSKDSRFFGPVPRSALKGRVIRILAPPSKAGAVPGSR